MLVLSVTIQGMPKSSNTQTKKGAKSPLFIMALGLAAGILGYALILNPALNYFDKQRFVRAEAHLQELSEEINQAVNASSATHTQNSCRYSSAKFDEGTLSCGVEIEKMFNANSADRAIEHIETVSRLSNTRVISSQDLLSDSTAENEELLDSFQSIAYDKDNMSCSVEYLFAEPNLTMTLSCVSSARSEHFDIVE